ncbi:MAG: hypothetical protein E3K37_02385 [Candidatus Kuenenia sp.]|nr:hypothetical protein [Candidatus Kuenenia hertensis]
MSTKNIIIALACMCNTAFTTMAFADEPIVTESLHQQGMESALPKNYQFASVILQEDKEEPNISTENHVNEKPERTAKPNNPSESLSANTKAHRGSQLLERFIESTRDQTPIINEEIKIKEDLLKRKEGELLNSKKYLHLLYANLSEIMSSSLTTHAQSDDVREIQSEYQSKIDRIKGEIAGIEKDIPKLRQELKLLKVKLPLYQISNKIKDPYRDSYEDLIWKRHNQAQAVLRELRLINK